MPDMNGIDKQEIRSAYIWRKILWSAFEHRIRNLKKDDKLSPLAFLALYLVFLLVNYGNHDLWEHYTKHSLPLSRFMELLKSLLLEDIARFWNVQGWGAFPIDDIKKLIDEKIIFVGESQVATIGNVRVGLKHPHKARSLSKSQRIQEAVSYFYDQGYRDVPLVYVANFHEAAAALISLYGKTMFGVMTGAFVKDSKFERHKDKVVEYGPALVTAIVDPNSEVIYAEVRYDSRIDPVDQKFVDADHITNEMILRRSLWLARAVGDKSGWRT